MNKNAMSYRYFMKCCTFLLLTSLVATTTCLVLGLSETKKTTERWTFEWTRPAMSKPSSENTKSFSSPSAKTHRRSPRSSPANESSAIFTKTPKSQSQQDPLEIWRRQEYTFPDTYKAGDNYLTITWSSIKTCQSDPHCLQVIVADGLYDRLRIHVVVLPFDQNVSVTDCESSEEQSPSACDQSQRSVVNWTPVPAAADTTATECGLSFFKERDVSTGKLGYITVTKDYCPIKVRHDCRMLIKVWNGKQNVTASTKFKLCDRDEKPECPSSIHISEPCKLTEIDCKDRDAYLMDHCDAIGCRSHTSNVYRVIPENVLSLTSEGNHLRLKVLKKLKPFTANIEVHSRSGHFAPFNRSVQYEAKKAPERVNEATGLLFKFDSKFEMSDPNYFIISTYLKSKIKEYLVTKIHEVDLKKIEITFIDANRTEGPYYWAYDLWIQHWSCNADENLAEIVKKGKPTMCFEPQTKPVGAEVLQEPASTDADFRFDEKLELCCKFKVLLGTGTSNPRVTWQFQNEPLKVSSFGAYQARNDIVTIMNQTALNVTIITIENCLVIAKLKPLMVGQYQCVLLNEHQQEEEEEELASDIRSIPDVYMPPRVTSWPVETWAEAGDLVRCVCHFYNVFYYRVDIIDQGMPSKPQTFGGNVSNSSLIFERMVKVHNQSIKIFCTGFNLTCRHCSLKKEITIYLFQNDNETIPCEQTTDNRGLVWARCLGGKTVTTSCPEGYRGQVTKFCSQTGQWETSDYSKCENEKLVELEEKIEFTKKNFKPSTKRVTELSSDLLLTLNQTEAIQSNDVTKTVDILDKLATLVTPDESQHRNRSMAVVTNSALEDIAKVADQILSAGTTEWQEVIDSDNAVDVDEPPPEKASKNTASRLCLAMDSLVSSSLNDSNMKSGTIINDNIAISRQAVKKNEDVISPTESEKETSDVVYETSAFLPAEAVPTDQGEIRYAAVRYMDIEDKLPSQLSFQKPSRCEPSPSRRQSKSEVLGFTLNVQVHTLSPRLEMSFKVDENSTNHLCGFLKPSDGTWSTDGCETEFVEEDMTVLCSCDHLTNFMVLMDQAGVVQDMTTIHHLILSKITIIGFSVSITCLLVTILAYALFWRYVRSDRFILHLNLSVCLTLFYIVFLAGIDTCSERGCTAVAVILHYVLLVAFFLMLSEGMEVFFAVVVVFPTRERWWKYLIFAYGIPAFIVLVTLAATEVEYYRSDYFCWLDHENGVIWAFSTFVILISTVNVVLCVIILRKMAGTTTMQNRENVLKAKAIAKALIVLSPLMGITWLFGMFAYNNKIRLFEYLFVICNSLQGLVLFIFHCLLSREVQIGFRHLYRKIKVRKTSTTSASHILATRSIARKDDTVSSD